MSSRIPGPDRHLARIHNSLAWAPEPFIVICNINFDIHGHAMEPAHVGAAKQVVGAVGQEGQRHAAAGGREGAR